MSDPTIEDIAEVVKTVSTTDTAEHVWFNGQFIALAPGSDLRHLWLNTMKAKQYYEMCVAMWNESAQAHLDGVVASKE